MIKLFLFFSSLIVFNQCLSLRPPAIVFTQTATAAEKQLVGDNKDIEKDGWIISSIRTSATGSSVWEREKLEAHKTENKEDKEIYFHLRRLAYFSGEVRDYKKKGFIGEALDGKLKSNPKIKESEFLETYPPLEQRISEILPIINESREIIFQKRYATMHSQHQPNQNLEQKRKKLLLVYYNLTESGEYFESSVGKWSIKE